MSLNEQFKKVNIFDYVTDNCKIELEKLSDDQYRGNPSPCCNHNDCFTLHSNINSFYCFSCRKGGTVADLMIATNKASDVFDAARRLELKSESSYIKPYQPPIAPRIAGDDVKSDYFQSRGLSDSIVIKYGLKVVGDTVFLPGGITRSISKKQYFNPKGESVPFFNTELLKEQDFVFVCEGIFDALSIEECGYKAISLNSASNVGKFIDGLITDSILISAFDNDDAGKKAYAELKQHCKGKGIALENLTVVPYKDVNELLIQDREELKKRLQNAIGINAPRSEFFDQMANKEKQLYRSTGLPSLDRALGGGLIPDLYCVGGVPASGKSAFMLQVASNLCRNGSHVIYFSLELSASEIDSRNASRLSFNRDEKFFLTALEINSGNIAENKKAIFLTIEDEYKKTFETFRVDCSCRTAQDVATAVKKYKILNRISPVIIVDYLQQLQGEDGKTEKQIMDNSVLMLKHLSNDLNTPVLFIASLNRAGYKVGDMASFKESGSVEYTAAVAMTLKPSKEGLETVDERKEGSEEAKKRPINMELEILKNRHYISGVVNLDFYGSGNFFRETNR